jgi:trimeric autotransporter adhesin
MYAADIFCDAGWYIDDIKISGLPINGTDFLSFTLPDQYEDPDIDYSMHAIDGKVVYGTDLSDMIPTFALDEGATVSANGVSQISGITSNNYTNPLTYLVKAENGTEQEWTITVSIAPNTKAEILSFTVPGQTGNTLIDPANQIIIVKVPEGTDLSNLVASFTLSDNAHAWVGDSIQTSGVTVNDFRYPLTYYVIAEDSVSYKDWIVTVEKKINSTSDIPPEKVSIFPNPTDGAIIINLNHQPGTEQVIQLFDTFGRLIKEQIITDKETRISISDQSPGIYFFRFKDGLTSRIIRR